MPDFFYRKSLKSAKIEITHIELHGVCGEVGKLPLQISVDKSVFPTGSVF